MFSCNNLTVKVGKEDTVILDNATVGFKGNALHAIIGPSGCGKTTLVKAMAGIYDSEGEVFFGDQPIESYNDLIGKVGFTPQFSIAHERLTVVETLQYSLKLNVSDSNIRKERLEKILSIIGLDEHQEKKVNSLSGGQLRRLGLGLELTNDPELMVCDEVTSGLDPRSEDQILGVLRKLQEKQQKSFICIIHNLLKLPLFDIITVVNGGRVVFQGAYKDLLYYFGIKDVLHLYERLNNKESDYWRDSWEKHQGYYLNENATEEIHEAPHKSPISPPSILSQFNTLLARRFKLFFRDQGYLWLTMAITFGFPILVVIFALEGLPQIQGLAMNSDLNVLESIQENIRYQRDAFELASLITGLIMFQVILLSLMGANNGSREIVQERVIFEKERLNGLNPYAYASSKIFFTSLIACFQGAWMAIFVKTICEFPGSWPIQVGLLSLACISMTIVCLGFSALFESQEKASSLSIYLVGFQLPLSGVVLALPPYLVWVCRPFINAYWGWSGYLSTMKDTRFHDAFRLNDASWMPTPTIAGLVLLLQLLLGAILVYSGCYKKHKI